MANGLLAAGFNFSMVDAGEFNDWYDTEHLPERKGCEGFLNAVRWVGVDDPKVAIATYDLVSHQVLHDPAYLAIARDNLSPWSKRITAKMKRLLRIEADQLIPGNEVARNDSPNLLIFASNVKAENEVEVLQWYTEEHIGNLKKVPGVISARFFHSHAGTHNYVALYEMDSPQVCTSAEWKAAALTPWTKKMRPFLNDVLYVVLKRYGSQG
jgi:hypothetical protein